MMIGGFCKDFSTLRGRERHADGYVEPFRAPLTANQSDVLFQSKISEEILTEESNNKQIDKNRYEDTNNRIQPIDRRSDHLRITVGGFSEKHLPRPATQAGIRKPPFQVPLGDDMVPDCACIEE